MDRMTRGDRLRVARERLGISQAEMAKKLGLAVSTYSSKERAQQPGGRDFKWEEAKGWASQLRCDANWLYTGEGQAPSSKAKGDGHVAPQPNKSADRLTTAVVGWFGAPTGEGALYGFDSEHIERPCFAGDLTVALEIKGKSLTEGMFAFFDNNRAPFRPDLRGLVVLGLGDSRITLRRIRGDGKGVARIEPYAGEQTALQPSKIAWAARVLAIAPR